MNIIVIIGAAETLVPGALLACASEVVALA